MQILMLTVLCVIVTLVNSGSLFDNTAQADLERYKLRVKLLHELLVQENCPGVRSVQVKRDLLLTEADFSEHQLEVEKKLYQGLTEELVMCRKAKTLKPSTTTTKPATSPDTPKPTATTSTLKPLPTTKPTQTITSKPATTTKTSTAKQTTQTTSPTIPTPSGPCSSPQTVNLTESWRKDSAGSHLKPINGRVACDSKLQDGVTWFRFSGDGGVQLSDKCRPDRSCGSDGGFWSNAPMPVNVGEIRKVPIYGSYTGNCNSYDWGDVKNPLTVQRCSRRVGDFVYKVKGNKACSWTFCGMDL